MRRSGEQHGRSPAQGEWRAGRAGQADVRASDSDREATAEALRRHATAGRLDADELDERMGAALSARTQAELASLLADLPATTGAAAPPARDAAHAPAWSRYLAVMTLLVAIWLLTGAGHPWPLYPALGWGIPLLAAARGGAGCARARPAELS